MRVRTWAFWVPSTMKGVGDVAGEEDEGAGAGLDVSVAAAEADLALEDEEGLVLAAVDVEGRGGAGGDMGLDEAEGSAGVLGKGLDRHPVLQEPGGLTLAGVGDVWSWAGVGLHRVSFGLGEPLSSATLVRGDHGRCGWSPCLLEVGYSTLRVPYLLAVTEFSISVLRRTWPML
jgi:hypothetical protein